MQRRSGDSVNGNRPSFWASIGVVLGFVAWLGSVAPLAAQAPDAKLTELVAALQGREPTALLTAIDGLTELGSTAAPGVAGLTKLLEHTDAQVRGRAARALGAIGPASEPAVAALAERLKSDETGEVRAYAAYALGQIGAPADNAEEALIAALTDEHPLVRRQALRAIPLVDPDPKRALEGLVKLLVVAQPHERGLALGALTEFGPQAVATLDGLLYREDTVHGALLVLGELGPAALPALKSVTKLLESNDTDTRREALLTVAGMGPEASSALSAILPHLKSSEPTVRAAAALALGRMGPAANAAVPALNPLLNDADPIAQTVIVWALTEIEPNNLDLRKRARGLLLAALDNPQPGVRRAALQALAKRHGTEPDVARRLVEFLIDEDPALRGIAEQVLVEQGPKAIPALETGLREPKLRAAVVTVVRHMGPQLKEILPLLVPLLKDPSPATRCHALLSLAAIGPEGASSVDAVRGCLSADQPIEVQRHAVFALGYIGKISSELQGELTALLAAKDPVLAAGAAWALTRPQPALKLDAERLVAASLPALDQNDDFLTGIVLETLGHLGPAAKSALPTLERLAPTTHPEVQADWQEVIKKIRGS